MARIRSPHHTVPLHLLALAIAALPGVIQAQTAEKSLPETTVKSEAASTYKTDKAANPKLNQPLVNTPQTI